MNIAGRKIGRAERPYIIAEMSGNHNGSLDRALAIVDAAAEAGADAVKLQTYTADTMTLDLDLPDFMIQDPDSLWSGRQLYDLYREAHTPWDWHRPIFERARERGIVCFSSPFDASAVEFLESLGAPAYKIASFENVDLPLIRKVAATGKPMIISTGLAGVAEISEALAAAREAGARDIVLLKCTSSYPATAENSNLATIPNLIQTFGVEAGLSDHTMGIAVAVASVVLGACVIEKHFTLARSDGGVDSAFSLEPHELRALREGVDQAQVAVGGIRYGGTAAEAESRKFRRSLYIAKDMRRGDVLNETNLRAVRPGYGLPPKYLAALLGKRVGRDLVAGTPASWAILSAGED
jgi:N-acetylneuraminate synthase